MVYLKSIISYFPSAYVCKYADDILKEIEHFNLEERLQLVKAMGMSLIKEKPRWADLKLKYLNFGWEQLAQTQKAVPFMDCASVLVEFAIKNMKQESVNNFISEIFKRFRDFVRVEEDEELY